MLIPVYEEFFYVKKVMKLLSIIIENKISLNILCVGFFFIKMRTRMVGTK
jgi:hypothetical protein